MLIFSMPRSGSTAFAEKLAIDNDLINNKEFFNRNVRGFNPYLGTYVIKGDLNYVGNFRKVDTQDLIPNLPANNEKRIQILKNSPLNIEEYVVKILPHHVSWISYNLINLFKDVETYILDRKDTLRQFLSWYFANKTKRFHNRSEEHSGEGFRTYAELTEAYNDSFPNGVKIELIWFERWVQLFQKYVYGTFVIRKHFSNVKVIKYEDISYQKELGNKKITIDYTNWVNNIEEVKKFTDEISSYKKKIIFNEN
tara:strand:+ start:232 stop:990 length:759 start_codon:yes stop_codon:yes gene_type:complete